MRCINDGCPDEIAEERGLPPSTSTNVLTCLSSFVKPIARPRRNCEARVLPDDLDHDRVEPLLMRTRVKVECVAVVNVTRQDRKVMFYLLFIMEPQLFST